MPSQQLEETSIPKTITGDQPQSKEDSVPKVVSIDSFDNSPKHKKTLTMDVGSMDILYYHVIR